MRLASVVFDSSGREVLALYPEDQAEMEAGLRGRPGLAMLFHYGMDVAQEMTMEGVEFPLDFVFLDSGGHVVEVLPDVPPGAKVVRCERPCASVLELPVDSIRRLFIMRGDRARIETYFEGSTLRPT